MSDRRVSGFRELEETVESQAARIADLSRTCASLVEDNKAFRQRMERERERVIDAEKGKLAQVLLEAHDGLEMAWKGAGGVDSGAASSLRTLLEGVRLTLSGLEKQIAALGATRLEVLGLPFDPRTGEAVDLALVEDPARDGVVVEELRSGWRIGDRVLRPARVRVGKVAQA